MKLLLLVAFVAACTASSLVRSRTVSTGDDGSILISNSFSGRRVQIYKPTVLDGQNSIEISVAGPNFPSKVIRIYEGPEYGTENEVSDEVRPKRSFSKVISSDNGDVFFLILKDYVGPVTDSQWDKLLTRVQTAVRQGVVVPEIYDLLVGLDFVEANYIWQAIQKGEQVFGQAQQGQTGYAPFFGRGVYQTPSQYYQRQGLYQYQGPYTSQYYQGQYPYYQSQYQGPYNSQYYKEQYPYYQYQSQGPYNGQYLNVKQQSLQELPSTTYSKKSVDVNTVTPFTQQQYYAQQPQSYFGQYFQKYYSQQQPQNFLGQYAQNVYGQQQPESYLKQYYGQPQSYLGQFLQQYYGQKFPVYGQQQQYYGQYYPYSQQYSSYPYQQGYQVPQTVY